MLFFGRIPGHSGRVRQQARRHFSSSRATAIARTHRPT